MSDEAETDLERLRSATAMLGEHFDTVQIFTSRLIDEGSDKGCTVSCNHGVGNWFARDGQVREWILKNDEASCRSVKDPE